MIGPRRLTRALAAVALAGGALLVGAPMASAHSQLISTSPADGAVLDAPPTEVRLTFDAPLLDDTDTISINDANGNVVKSIHPKPEGDSVAIPWPDGTPPGQYQVAYRVVCGDGHPVIGALLLTINGTGPASGAASPAAAAAVASAAAASPAAGQPAASPAPQAAAPSTEGRSPVVMVLGIAIILGGIVAVIVALMMRRRAHTPAA